MWTTLLEVNGSTKVLIFVEVGIDMFILTSFAYSFLKDKNVAFVC
jgi:hypothetical protein